MKKILSLSILILVTVTAVFAADWTVSAGAGATVDASKKFEFTYGVDVEYEYNEQVSFFGSLDTVSSKVKARLGVEYLLGEKGSMTVSTGVGALYESGCFGASLRVCSKYQIKDAWSAFAAVNADYAFIKGKAFSCTAKLGVSYAF